MKNLVVLLAVGLQACSSVSKETYTETRTFKYPKGITPHIKDMYLRDNDAPQEQNTYIGTHDPAVHPIQPIQPIAPVINNTQSDIDFILDPLLGEDNRTFEQIDSENVRLRALALNRQLRGSIQ